ncbi:putative membrane spanning protein [Granulibacter bethesdensis]|nr:putative membrane spanning protein [Granulibacter bethesdensis]
MARRECVVNESSTDYQAPISEKPRPFFQYDGKTGELYKIFLINLLLSIVTLGIYRFWAISRMRRYLWSRCRFQETRFTYTGTGGELFLGFLKVLGLLILLIAATGAAAYGLAKLSPSLVPVPIIAAYIFVVLLAVGAPYAAQRYRLSRTEWNGIRGGMTGSLFTYAFYALLYGVLTILTLYQLAPWAAVRLTEYRINNSQFGSENLSFYGRAGRLYLAFLATFLIMVVLFFSIALLAWYGLAVTFGADPWVFGDNGRSLVTLFKALPHLEPEIAKNVQTIIALVGVGALFIYLILATLISCWYIALFIRHVIGNTTYASFRFFSTVTGLKLLGQLTGNFLITLFTLGLGLPFVIQRNMRFLERHTLVIGNPLPAEWLHQNTQSLPATGEGLLNVFDGGSGF